MKQSVFLFFLSNVFIGTGLSNFAAYSFTPIADTYKETHHRHCPMVPFQANAIEANKSEYGYICSSLRATPTYEIIGPEIPPVQESSKRLFLVRHGEVINPGGDRPVYYGALDVPLSPLGEDEAKAAASYLQHFELNNVISSPLSRAVYGAEQILILQNNKEVTVVKMEGFRELDRGSWCGMTKDEIGVDIMAKFDACDETVTPQGGESYITLKKRVLEGRDEMLDRLPKGKAAAIVSHLQVTRSMLSDALGIPTAKMAGLAVATASVTCIDYDTDGAQTVHFQSFKPDVGLAKSKDGAN